MTPQVRHRESCRLCDSRKVERVVKLEPIPLSEHYASDAEAAKRVARFPVDVYMCPDCGHVQQLDVVDSHSLWDNYTYFSGQAKGMPEHFARFAGNVLRTYQPPPGALVVDVGSNDGSLLRPFRDAGYRVVGIDPAKEIARQATAAGIPTYPELMSLDLARRIRAEHGPAHVVCAFNAYAHADNMAEMTDAIRHLMHDDALFFFEVQYLLDIIDGVLIATIFHEHMSHHSMKPMSRFLDSHGLQLIEVERVPIQHGSVIGTVQVKGARRSPGASVRDILALEERRKLGDVATLRAFSDKLGELRATGRRLAEEWQRSKVQVAGYGAARSGPTLIAQLGLAGAIGFIVDDHPQKVGRYSSGDGIRIEPTRTLLARMPAYTVILAWVHAEKIIESNREYLEKGGRFVVLCPDIRVVDKAGSRKI